MAATLTGSKIKDSYTQLLHVDGGISATEKVVRTGSGAATALKLGVGSASVENIRLDGNTISAINDNGDLNLAANGSGKVNISAANISSGTVSGITDLAIADGGTGASTASGARTNLGLGSMATQNNSNVTITGGSVSNVTLSSSAATITGGSVLASTGLGYNSGLGAGGSVTQITNKTTPVTVNTLCGSITTTADAIGANSSISIGVSCSAVAATDVVVVSIKNGAPNNTYIASVSAVSAGSFVLQITNLLASSQAHTLVINYFVLKSAVT